MISVVVVVVFTTSHIFFYATYERTTYICTTNTDVYYYSCLSTAIRSLINVISVLLTYSVHCYRLCVVGRYSIYLFIHLDNEEAYRIVFFSRFLSLFSYVTYSYEYLRRRMRLVSFSQNKRKWGKLKNFLKIKLLIRSCGNWITPIGIMKNYSTFKVLTPPPVFSPARST